MYFKRDESMQWLSITYEFKNGEMAKNLVVKERGIYGIMCLRNFKVYVGQSINMKKRIRIHEGELRDGKHINRHLQSAYDKYGADSFVAYSIEIVPEGKELSEREAFWAGEYDSFRRGYNQAPITPGDQNWHLDDEQISSNRNYKLNRQDAAVICGLLNKGFKKEEIGKAFGVSRQTVQKIKLKRIWREEGEKRLQDANLKKRKLSGSEVSEICVLLNRGIPMAEIARRFKVTHNCIWNIKSGISWKEETEGLIDEALRSGIKPRLTEEDIIEVCKLINGGTSSGEIAKRYNITQTQVSLIRNRKSWKHIGDIHLNGSGQKTTKLSEQEVIEVCRMLNEEKTSTVISAIMGVGRSTINDIKKGRTWKAVGEKHLTI